MFEDHNFDIDFSWVNGQERHMEYSEVVIYEKKLRGATKESIGK